MRQTTLWELLREKWKGKGAAKDRPTWNPLQLRIGEAKLIDVVSTQLRDYSWTVDTIAQYTRTLNGQEFKFTDYLLGGINTKTFAAEDKKRAKLRCVPDPDGGCDQILLNLEDEFKFDPAFLEVVNDTSGRFEVSEDDGTTPALFERINMVEGGYQAQVLESSTQNEAGEPDLEKAQSRALEYWDFWREPVPGGLKEFVFVEKDGATGWFQIWRGKEYVE